MNAFDVDDDRLSVMVVDDSNLFRTRLVELLGQLTSVKVVAEAADVPEAIELFEDRRPLVVILDLELPYGSGFELLARFKAARPDCAIVVLSGYGVPEMRERAEALGAEFFFEKGDPFDDVASALLRLAGHFARPPAAATPRPFQPPIPGGDAGGARREQAAEPKSGLPVVREAFPVGPLLAEVAENLAAVARARGVRVERSVPTGLPAAWADRRQIRDLVAAVLDNALRHSPRGTVVEIEVGHDSRVAGGVRITVRDQGPGMPEAVRAEIAGVAAGGRGERLGQLASCARVARMHGGRLWVEATAGTGASVCVSLPGMAA
jgi:two-component system response regulator DesR